MELLPLTGDSGPSSWHVEWLFMLLDFAVVGQPSIFLARSPAVGLVGLSLSLVYSVSVQWLTPLPCLLPRPLIRLAAEVESTSY